MTDPIRFAGHAPKPGEPKTYNCDQDVVRKLLDKLAWHDQQLEMFRRLDNARLARLLEAAADEISPVGELHAAIAVAVERLRQGNPE